MRAWRLGTLVLLFLLVALPLAMPIAAFVRQPSAMQALLDGTRLLILTRNTALLIIGALIIAVPPGILLAILLYRTDLPFRRLLRWLIFMTLFVPLPLFASGWQAALGSGGWITIPAWTTGDSAWTPWAQGVLAACWIHGLAGLPWIVLLVGQGLCWVERELEEEALMVVGPWSVLRKVTLRRAGASLGAALIWVAILTATEITVTDMMQVRTFAEEVYNQFTRPEVGQSVALGLASALAVNLPAIAVCWILLWTAMRRFEQGLPPLDRLSSTSPLLFRLGQWRWPLLILTGLLCGFVLGVPLGSLVWKAGSTPAQPWSKDILSYHLATTLHIRGGLIGESVLWAAVAGTLVAGLALVVCWLATDSRWMRQIILLFVVTAWVIPGPVVGIGLKETINLLMDLTHSGTLADALYYGYSPLPLLWAYLLRFFPAAVALLWPVVRLMPRELIEAARVDGASPSQELSRVVWPLTALPLLMASLSVAVLALGELSASKLVETPGSQTFAHEVFTQMHYGVTNDLAALCLWLLLALTGGATAVSLIYFYPSKPIIFGGEQRTTNN